VASGWSPPGWRRDTQMVDPGALDAIGERPDFVCASAFTLRAAGVRLL
jgi:hypothetical protein